MKLANGAVSDHWIRLSRMVIIALMYTQLLYAQSTTNGTASILDIDTVPSLPLIGVIKLNAMDGFIFNPTDAEVAQIISKYQGLHITGANEFLANHSVWKKFNAADPAFLILPYFQSTISGGVYGLGTSVVEKDPLNLISMYKIGVLSYEIDAETTTFTVDTSGNALALKASTTTGDTSTSASTYISLLRIEDEILKVLTVNISTRQVTVRRGYKGTTAAPHSASSNILSPVYRQNRNPDNGINSLVPLYHIKIDSEKAAIQLAAVGKNFIDAGATGLWLDLTSSGIFKPCDIQGNSVTPWNFETEAEYAKNPQGKSKEYFLHQKLKIARMRTEMKRLTGIDPYLASNNHSAGPYFMDNVGTMQMAQGTEPAVNALIFENAFSLYSDLEFKDLNIWKANLGALIHGSQNNVGTFTWLKNVVYADLPRPNNSESSQYQLYDYASALLGFETNSGSFFPTPLFWQVDPGTDRGINIESYMTSDIGYPLHHVTANENLATILDTIDDLRISGKNSYMRYFSKGAVLVNPTSSDDTNIPLGEEYYDPASPKHTFSSLSMPAHTGKILLKTTENTNPHFIADPFSKKNAYVFQYYTNSITQNIANKEGVSLRIEKLTGPTWLHLSDSGILSGIPLLNDAGINTFTLRLTTDEKYMDESTLHIDVQSIEEKKYFFRADFSLSQKNPNAFNNSSPSPDPIGSIENLNAGTSAGDWTTINHEESSVYENESGNNVMFAGSGTYEIRANLSNIVALASHVSISLDVALCRTGSLEARRNFITGLDENLHPLFKLWLSGNLLDDGGKTIYIETVSSTNLIATNIKRSGTETFTDNDMNTLLISLDNTSYSVSLDGTQKTNHVPYLTPSSSTLGYLLFEGNTTWYDNIEVTTSSTQSSTEYSNWVTTNRVTQGLEGDDDSDGLPNRVEFGCGGDPNDPLDQGTLPIFKFSSNNLEYIHVKRKGINYRLQQKTNLVSKQWQTITADESDEAIVNEDFNIVTNRINNKEPAQHQFFRIQIDMQ